MKRALTILTLLMAAVTGGCSPVASMRPLYTNEDAQKPVIEPRIEGEWVSPDSGEPEKAAANESWAKWKIVAPPAPAGAYTVYSVEFAPAKPEAGKGKQADTYDVRLVAIGDKLFFDAEFRKYTDGQTEVGQDDILGLVPAHLVGRVWVQQDFLRIALLKPDWVESNWPTGFYKYDSSNYGDDSLVITGSTQELRDFLVRNADNPEALGYAVYLCRAGADCAERAAEDTLARTPDDEDALDSIAKFFIARGDYARAAALRKHRVELKPEDSSRHADLGEALLLEKEFAGARRELEAAKKRILGDPPAQPSPLPNNSRGAYAQAAENVVWSYFLEGKYEEAYNAGKSYKVDEMHLSANPPLLGYYSLIRLGRQGTADSYLKEETEKFKGAPEEHILLLYAQGRVSEGLPHAEHSEPTEGARREAYFAGLRDIASGHSGIAKVHLEYAAPEQSHSVIALAARVELERLGRK